MTNEEIQAELSAAYRAGRLARGKADAKIADTESVGEEKWAIQYQAEGLEYLRLQALGGTCASHEIAEAIRALDAKEQS